LFSSFDIALAMSEGAQSLGEVTRVYLVPLILADAIFHGFCSIIVPRIDYRPLLANFPLMLSFEAIIKPDGHLRNANISHADI
jgi:hypothetical protein